MGRPSLEEQVSAVAEDSLVGSGIELVDVEYAKTGKDWHLRIFIDRKGGVTLDDCQEASERIGEALDRLNLVDQRYYLEVSSPGERPFRKDADFERYKGEWVELKLNEPFNGHKRFEGRLLGLENGCIAVETDSEEKVVFERAAVAVTRRVFRL